MLIYAWYLNLLIVLRICFGDERTILAVCTHLDSVLNILPASIETWSPPPFGFIVRTGFNNSGQPHQLRSNQKRPILFDVQPLILGHATVCEVK